MNEPTTPVQTPGGNTTTAGAVEQLAERLAREASAKHGLSMTYAVAKSAALAALTHSGLSGDAGEDGRRIVRFSDEKGDFVVGEDGCTIFWPEGLSRGGFNAWHLRALADELERRNADWLAQMRADFAALPSHKGAGG